MKLQAPLMNAIEMSHMEGRVVQRRAWNVETNLPRPLGYSSKLGSLLPPRSFHPSQFPQRVFSLVGSVSPSWFQYRGLDSRILGLNRSGFTELRSTRVRDRKLDGRHSHRP